jgi:hypothetical protein
MPDYQREFKVTRARALRRFDLNFLLTRASNVLSMTARYVSPTLLALTALLTSCRKPEIQTYRVAKDPATASADSTASPHAPAAPAGTMPSQSAGPSSGSAAAPGGTTMANTAVPTAGGPGLTWKAPAHWQQKPSSAMRKGSFTIAGEGGEADLSISAFPGDVGGDLANVNRWRDQLQLPPVNQAEFQAASQRLEKNGLRMTVVDLAGNGKRTLGAMIPYGDGTWFVKLMGPDALVAKEKPVFMAFLDSIKAPTK